MTKALVRKEIIENKIYIIRGQKVMLDKDLAWLYEVETKRLNEGVKRNIERFPEDFMFQLTQEEYENLRSQIATANKKINMVRSLPYAFTEHGVGLFKRYDKTDKDRVLNPSLRYICSYKKELEGTNDRGTFNKLQPKT